MITRIRPAAIDDVPALVAMGRRFIQGTPYGAWLAENPTQLAETASRLIAGAGVVFVADRDGLLVGMIGVVLATHFLSGECVAGEVFWWTDREARGSGVRLFVAAERWAREQGARWLQMIAPDDHVGAFYERRGYQPVERTYQRAL